MKAVLRIIRYLKGTTGHGVLFKQNGHLETQLYTDADWVGDKGDRRSTSGYLTLVGGNLVTWRSKKQKVVALSKTMMNMNTLCFLRKNSRTQDEEVEDNEVISNRYYYDESTTKDDLLAHINREGQEDLFVLLTSSRSSRQNSVVFNEEIVHDYRVKHRRKKRKSGGDIRLQVVKDIGLLIACRNRYEKYEKIAFVLDDDKMEEKYRETGKKIEANLTQVDKVTPLNSKRFEHEEKDKEEIFGDTNTVGSTSKSPSEWRSSITCRDTGYDPFSSSSRRSCPKWESYTFFQKYDEEMLFLDRISVQKLKETALNWNYNYFQQLRASRRGCPAYIAQQFQQFQVVLQHYIENEPYQNGRRPIVFARMRSIAPKLLQVPEYRDSDDEKKDEYLGSRISSESFLGAFLSHQKPENISGSNPYPLAQKTPPGIVETVVQYRQGNEGQIHGVKLLIAGNSYSSNLELPMSSKFVQHKLLPVHDTIVFNLSFVGLSSRVNTTRIQPNSHGQNLWVKAIFSWGTFRWDLLLIVEILEISTTFPSLARDVLAIAHQAFTRLRQPYHKELFKHKEICYRSETINNSRGGRVGGALQDMGTGQDLLVKIGAPVPLVFPGPILVCSRNDDLDVVLNSTP
ncbi:ribosomal protein L34Ae protein [Tanacetum coccineum]